MSANPFLIDDELLQIEGTVCIAPFVYVAFTVTGSVSVSCRKRLSCSESLYMEGDASPPLGARRRFSALMDTHRFASLLDSESDLLSRHAPIKVRGTSLDGTNVPSPSLLEQRSSLKEISGAGGLAGEVSSGLWGM